MEHPYRWVTFAQKVRMKPTSFLDTPGQLFFPPLLKDTTPFVLLDHINRKHSGTNHLLRISHACSEVGHKALLTQETRHLSKNIFNKKKFCLGPCKRRTVESKTDIQSASSVMAIWAPGCWKRPLSCLIVPRKHVCYHVQQHFIYRVRRMHDLSKKLA